MFETQNEHTHIVWSIYDILLFLIEEEGTVYSMPTEDLRTITD